MKKLAWWVGGARGRLVFGALVMIGMAALLTTRAVVAQDKTGQGKYLTEAAARLGKLIGAANRDGYILYDNQFSVGGGWLKQGANNWVNLYTVTLDAGKRYRIIAAGDFDAKDVDLEVKDLNGNRVAADEDTASEAVINYTPDRTQKYLVRVRLYDSDQNLPCMCLAIVMVQK
jgi:hypothetical protein